MSSPILYRLGLIPRVSTKFTIDAISKSLIISQVFSEKIFEFGFSHWDPFRAMFILVPILNYCPKKKRGGKWDAVRSAGPSNIEMVLTLLTEAVAIFVQVSMIEIRESSFEGLFAKTKPVILFQQLDGSYISFQELPTQLLGETWSWSWGWS